MRVGDTVIDFMIDKEPFHPLETKKMWLLLLILVVFIRLTLASCQVTRAGYESAPFKVVRTDGKFQVRDYPALTVVETLMASNKNGDDGSFMRLFAFITGGNEANQKIAMTTPATEATRTGCGVAGQAEDMDGEAAV